MRLRSHFFVSMILYMEKTPNFNFEKRKSEAEVPELNETQRKGLRGLLNSLGVKLKPMTEDFELDNKSSEEHESKSKEGLEEEEPIPTRMSRRDFLKTSAGVVAAGALGPVIGYNVLGIGKQKEDKEEELESKTEKIENSLLFAVEIEGYKAFAELSKDEVLFLDENNAPVGEPQKFRDIVVKRKATASSNPSHVRPDGTIEYKLSPGKINEIGLPENGLASEWLDYVQTLKQAENPNQKIKRRMNVVGSFLSAYKEKDEPELVAKIAKGEIDKNIDIVKYFADKPVRGAEDFSRFEYAQKINFRSESDTIRNRPALPITVQKELKRILPGLFAQESKFNAGLVSKSKATGLAQIKPDVWKEYKGTTDVSLSMMEQMEVVGELMSDNYYYVLHFAGDDAVRVLKEKFNSDEDFNEELITPLIINAYNAGGPMIGKVIKDFVNNVSSDEMVSGRDLFLQIVDYAKENNRKEFKNYADEAREYVPRVYAMAEVLDETVG